MRFVDRAGREHGLFEAACLGLSEGGGLFFPFGDDDLRPAIYAPESSYTYFAASALAALFPGDIDPRLSLRLAEAAFGKAPLLVHVEEGIAVLELGHGPTGDRADQDAAFLAALLEQASKKEGPRLLLADGSGIEGAVLAEATAGLEGLETVLLYPEGEKPSGLRPSLLEREGGRLRIASVRGGGDQVAKLIAALAGKRLSGIEVTAAGPANPARLAARIVEFSAVFASFRSSAVGEFFFGLPEGDGLGLAACLWAWRLGVPLTGAVLPCRAGSLCSGSTEALGPEGHTLVSRLDEESPGLVKSLVAFREVDPAGTADCLARFESAAGHPMNPEEGGILAAAERMLDAGLRGHAKVYALVGRRPGAEGGGIAGNFGVAASDAVISPSLKELSAFLAR